MRANLFTYRPYNTVSGLCLARFSYRLHGQLHMLLEYSLPAHLDLAIQVSQDSGSFRRGLKKSLTSLQYSTEPPTPANIVLRILKIV